MFRFELRAMDEIEPWGEPGSFNLHWFGLTDGYYQIEAAGQYILKYSEAGWRELGWEVPPRPSGLELAVDYQVARLFEDLAGILPSVLEPVPDDIAQHLETPESHRSWFEFVGNWNWQDDTDAALLWANERALDSLYLRAGPCVTFWRTGDTIRMRCDNRDNQLDGVQIWSSELVEHQLPVREFLTLARSFADDLLDQMEERTRAVEAGWSRKGVRLDPANMRREHEAQCKRWASAITNPREPTDWAMVRRALRD